MKGQGRRVLGSATVRVVACALGLVGWVRASDRPIPPPRAKVGEASPIRGRTEGTAVPGSRIGLSLDRPADPGSRFFWVQTQGPPVTLEGQDGPEVKLTIPADAESLGFLLVVSDEQGMKSATFTIPIAGGTDGPAPVGSVDAPSGPRADAGDDTIGLVGRRVTLNGSESRPREGLGYRWIQVEGPPVGPLEESGRFCSFLPTVPGRYRFALVVALENRISPADFVGVSVGSLPTTTAGPIQGLGYSSVAPPMLASSAGGSTPFEAAVASAMAALDDAPAVAGPLSEIFRAASLRMDLYRTYGEIFSEMSRRLEAVIPADPIRRSRWNSALFEPLTARTVAMLLPLGLDLRTPGGQDATLTPAQKQELRGFFDRLADRLASARTSP